MEELTAWGEVVHAGCMAIRMKEWGMQQAPAAPARIPVENLHGWVESTEKLGRGVVSAVLGTQRILQAEEQITAGGELAAFSEQLHRIGDETAAELAEQQVEDWDYAWAQTGSPRFAEAVAALPPHARAAGAELAEAYSAQASLRALRDRKVTSIRQARQHWQQRVDDAVQAGDAQRAEQWLQSGAGVFVPPGEMQQRKQQVESKACVARWVGALQADPVQTLSDFYAATQTDLPAQETDRAGLAEQMQQQHARERRALAQSFAGGNRPAQPELERAVSAGILYPQEAETAAVPPRELSVSEHIDWLRRLDESADDETTQTDLLMAVGVAPMAADTRRRLVERMQMNARVAVEDRRAFSRRLLQLYADGGFGCPQDAEAQQRLRDLQLAGMPVLAQQGSEAAAEWLQALPTHGNAWVCFSDLT